MQRLDKILSEAGVASRKELKSLIRAGRVTVDGAVVREEAKKFDEAACTIAVDGAAVEKTGDTVMIDTANGVLGGNLSPLANGYNASNRTTAQDGFTFTIISGTTNGTTAVTDYSTLPEGIWSGDVSVQFDATWTS